MKTLYILKRYESGRLTGQWHFSRREDAEAAAANLRLTDFRIVAVN